ncbi:MAG: hypothetical protein U9R75_00770 [Candidatus Thermoplasmatota archaeon]|nr:hypothetical protein [Candidatus Thermoplasmatota archaeon]
MNDMKLPEELSILVGDGMFPDRSSLLSFCLAVGLFEGKRDSGFFGSMPEDLTEWEIWPLVQLIVHDMDDTIVDMKQMRAFLLEYLNGGVSIVMERTRGKKGSRALKRIADLLPP